jgi:hypothetical protein
MIMPAAQSTSSKALPALPAAEPETVHTVATKVGPFPSPAPAAASPSIPELEDVLYDLVAGGDLNLTSDKLELIQEFLHEHARQRKTHEEFVGFFQLHALSMRPERPNLFALPLVDSRNAARAPMLYTPDLEAAAAVEAEPIVVERSRFGWVWPALGFAAIAGALALGASAVVVMRAEIDRVNASVAHTAIELEQLRAETQQLRAIIQANSAAVQNTERDTRLLLQTIASPIAQNSR